MKTQKELETERDRLNALYPGGTPVRYWSMQREGPGRISRLRHRYTLLARHTVVLLNLLEKEAP